MYSFAQYLPLLTVLATVGCGLMAGLLFAFSNFVMQALVQLPEFHGLVAMQLINTAIINALFLIVFLGTAVLCFLIIVVSLLQASIPGTFWLVLGSTCYLIGVFGVTVVFNVPLNNGLTRADATNASASLWNDYVARWLWWNHVRTSLAVVATLSLVYGLYRLRDP